MHKFTKLETLANEIQVLLSSTISPRQNIYAQIQISLEIIWSL